MPDCTLEQFVAALDRVELGETPEHLGDPGEAWPAILAFVAGMRRSASESERDLRNARVLLELAQRRSNELDRFLRDLTALVEIRCGEGADATHEVWDVIRKFRDRPKRSSEPVANT